MYESVRHFVEIEKFSRLRIVEIVQKMWDSVLPHVEIEKYR
jgi:hypothetical protein